VKKKEYQANNAESRLKNGRSRKDQPKAIEGTIKTNSRGIGYFRAPEFKEDLEIEPYFLKTAFDGDTVSVIPHPKQKNKRLQGEVVKIIKRARNRFVGTLTKNESYYFLKTDNKKVYRDIIIPKEKTLDAKSNQKILVKITSWGDAKKNPEGEVVKIIGEKGTNEAEIQSIVLDKGLDTDFPKEIEKEAELVAQNARQKFNEEISSRKDFRNVLTFTIDPEDAKDFDDAISYQKLPDGVEVGVHIADVSYYVEEKSLLDREARNRGFSIYLVDRTIPMLPEVLSNDLCSLRPDEDRLVFSAVFKLDKNNNITSHWFGKSVIRSRKRFSYETAQKILDANPPTGGGEFFHELTFLNNFSKQLRKKRFEKGAIDFDSEEIRFELDETGKPIKVFKKARLDTHKLIEELMLMANREVAEFVYERNKKNPGFIFRTHDLPNREKIKELSVFLRALGYNLSLDERGDVSSKDLNALFAQIEGKAEESLIKTAAVRSMAKAVYSTKNIGHFGLAFRYYTHFTSPIRRYSDLLVHRFLEKSLNKKVGSEDFSRSQKIAMDLSEKEVKIAEAERDSIKYKQVEFMLPRIGETFDGIISGITEWGMYVEEIETKAEGMIKLRDLDGDFYELNEKQYSLVGQKTKKKFRLGDRVRVKLANVDLDRKQIDYRLA